jgi:hypothetical protein
MPHVLGTTEPPGLAGPAGAAALASAAGPAGAFGLAGATDPAAWHVPSPEHPLPQVILGRTRFIEEALV